MTENAEFFEAIIANNIALAERLIDGGADVDGYGSPRFTPLMLAASHGHLRMVELFLQKGVDVNRANDIGQTALMVAAQAGHTSVVQTLLVAGSDLQASDQEKRNAISWAVTRADLPEMVSLLAVSGADYDNLDNLGFTPLMRAAAMGFDQSVAVLLTVGANENIQVSGKTALQLAQERGNDKVCATIESVLQNRPPGHRI